MSTKSHRKSFAADVAFECEETGVVPVSAYDNSGELYSGPAEGDFGAAYWTGQFVAGRPHGKFSVFWGGIQGGDVCFQDGEQVN